MRSKIAAQLDGEIHKTAFERYYRLNFSHPSQISLTRSDSLFVKTFSYSE